MICFFQDICDRSFKADYFASARQLNCPLAACYQPQPLHEADHTVC